MERRYVDGNVNERHARAALIGRIFASVTNGQSANVFAMDINDNDESQSQTCNTVTNTKEREKRRKKEEEERTVVDREGYANEWKKRCREKFKSIHVTTTTANTTNPTVGTGITTTAVASAVTAADGIAIVGTDHSDKIVKDNLNITDETISSFSSSSSVVVTSRNGINSASTSSNNSGGGSCGGDGDDFVGASSDINDYGINRDDKYSSLSSTLTISQKRAYGRALKEPRGLYDALTIKMERKREQRRQHEFERRDALLEEERRQAEQVAEQNQRLQSRSWYQVQQQQQQQYQQRCDDDHVNNENASTLRTRRRRRTLGSNGGDDNDGDDFGNRSLQSGGGNSIDKRNSRSCDTPILRRLLEQDCMNVVKSRINNNNTVETVTSVAPVAAIDAASLSFSSSSFVSPIVVDKPNTRGTLISTVNDNNNNNGNNDLPSNEKTSAVPVSLLSSLSSSVSSTTVSSGSVGKIVNPLVLRGTTVPAVTTAAGSPKLRIFTDSVTGLTTMTTLSSSSSPPSSLSSLSLSSLGESAVSLRRGTSLYLAETLGKDARRLDRDRARFAHLSSMLLTYETNMHVNGNNEEKGEGGTSDIFVNAISGDDDSVDTVVSNTIDNNVTKDDGDDSNVDDDENDGNSSNTGIVVDSDDSNTVTSVNSTKNSDNSSTNRKQNLPTIVNVTSALMLDKFRREITDINEFTVHRYLCYLESSVPALTASRQNGHYSSVGRRGCCRCKCQHWRFHARHQPRRQSGDDISIVTSDTNTTTINNDTFDNNDTSGQMSSGIVLRCTLELRKMYVKLRTLYDTLMILSHNVQFDPATHVYRIVAICNANKRTAENSSDDRNNQWSNSGDNRNENFVRVERSVTESLDLIFGNFDADLVAQRMIASKRWRNNALYQELNFDENGNERKPETVVALLKNRWNEKRDKGTALHEYIHSLSSEYVQQKQQQQSSLSSQSAAVCTVNTSLSRVSNIVPSVNADTVVTMNSTNSNNSDDCLGTSDTIEKSGKSNGDDNGSDDGNGNGNGSGANFAIPTTAMRSWQVTDNHFVPFSSSITTIPSFFVDEDNVTAFDVFNRQRLRDGWLLLASEYVVYDLDGAVAGSIDAIYLPYPHLPELLVLVDWKRCDIDMGTRYSPFATGMRYQNNYTRQYPKCNYWKYAMQVNVYRELLERMLRGSAIVIDMLIVSLPERSSYPRVYSVPRLSDAQLFVDELRAAVR